VDSPQQTQQNRPNRFGKGKNAAPVVLEEQQTQQNREKVDSVGVKLQQTQQKQPSRIGKDGKR
jgi:hypothetical protein